MRKSDSKVTPATKGTGVPDYNSVLGDVVGLLEAARRTSARAVNAIMTAAYWEIGRRIVEYEQGGEDRAAYGEALLKKLSTDLTVRFGKGFSERNLEKYRSFFLSWPISPTLSAKFEIRHAPSDKLGILQTLSGISETVSRKSAKLQTPSATFTLHDLAQAFPLPWSHYVRLLSVKKSEAREFYEAEALRGGWSVRQLDRQVSSLFYERTLLSKNKAAMLSKGLKSKPEDLVTPEEELKDPFVLEFLGLKDEYSESQLEEALINKLESFLLELGGDFTFVGRQRRLRVGDEWYRIDLLFFHRRLRCLVVIDLKLGKFSPADAGQMHLYLNYAREHWTHPEENPPVGLILCAGKDAAVAHYALEGLPNKVLAAEYRMNLPEEKVLVAELQKTRNLLEARLPRTVGKSPKERKDGK